MKLITRILSSTWILIEVDLDKLYYIIYHITQIVF